MPAAIWSSQLRKDGEEEEEEDDEDEKEEEEEEKVTLIKSRGPHLAGGENQLNRKRHQLHQFGASQRNKPIALGHSEAFSQTLMRVLYAVLG